MKKHLTLLVLASLISSCASRAFNNQSSTKEEIDVMSLRSPVVTWVNPTTDSTEKSGLPNPELNEVAEGLILVGPDGKPAQKFDRRKPTVIYIHGWTPEEDIPAAPYTSAWYKDFNTFMYRWHRQSAERASVPARAITNLNKITKNFLADYDRLQTALGGVNGGEYFKEIRVVGYSLGGMLALELAENTGFANAGIMNPSRPRRIDLLELITDDSGVNEVRQTAHYVVDHYRLNHYARKARALKTGDTALTNFLTSGLSGFTAAMALPEMNVQMYSKEWLGVDFRKRHTSILPAYFESYGKPLPTIVNRSEKAFSAQSDTKELVKDTLFLKQVDSKNATGASSIASRDLSDDMFQAVQRPCEPPNFTSIDTSLFNGDGSKLLNSTTFILFSKCTGSAY